MFDMKRRKRNTSLLFVILLICASKSGADDSSQVSGDTANQGVDSKQVTAKANDAKSEEGDNPSSNQENQNDPLVSSNVDGKDKNLNIDEGDQKPGNLEGQVVDSKHSSDKVDASEQPAAGIQEDKNEGSKSDESPASVDSKKQITKEEDNNHKNNLNDVNAYTSDESPLKVMKRETRDYSEFLGLPRDASYFFDDHEPFVNNNSDNRVGRAAPSRESKGQKSKFSKSKNTIEEDAEDDEEDAEKEDEEEKVSEDDYDDDEDIDSDCQPTPACTSSTQGCQTTRPPCSASPKCTSPKCTTELKCSTTCRTTTEKTKCPRICAKVNRKLVGDAVSTEGGIDWDSSKKRLNTKKRRYHSKVNLGN